jgi:glycerophosphoryl diester phosphodiesterase
MKIIAHRGFSEKYPENTLLSFEKAIEAGADGIEIDLRLSLDEKVIVFHDSNLKRITGVDKEPEALNLDELQALDAGKREHIPSLDEVLRLIDARTTLILEVKYNPSTYKRLCRLISEAIEDKLSWVEVSSFDNSILEEMHKLNKNIKLHKVTNKASTLEDKDFHIRYEYIDCFDINVKLSKIALEKGFIKRYRVIFWTVDKEEVTEEIEEGLYGVITNSPQRLKEQYA